MRRMRARRLAPLHRVGRVRRLTGAERLTARLGELSGQWFVLGAAAVVFTVVFVNWFRPGWFFATGDLGLFVRRGAGIEWGAAWTHENSGAGGAAYTVVRLPELVLTVLARVFGGGEPLAERLLFAAMFAWAAAGGAALVRRFCSNGVLIVGGGVLAAFNLLTLSGLPNYLPVVVIGVIGLLTARSIDAARGTPVRATGLALCTLPMSYVSLNPPLVFVVLGWVSLLPLLAPALAGTAGPGRRRAFAVLGTAAPLAVAINLWWVVPQVMAIGRARSSGTIGAQTDVSAWAWTHQHNSLANVMTLRSAWSWPDPDSHGLAANVLGHPSVAWLAWLLPAGVALAGLFATRHRRLVHIVALGCVATWLVGKGLHEPGRSLNELLYEHVPGFWLLREPMSKVGVIPLLGTIVCWAIGLDALVERARRRLPALRHTARSAGVALLAVGPFVLAWPMLSGQVTRDLQPGRHEQVQLPAGWSELAADVNGSTVAGKVLVLPLIDFYQIPTTWGFYGTDTLLRGLIERPVVLRNPQGYLTDLPAYDQLVRSVESALLAGRADSVEPLLRTLGVSHVLVRHDIDRSSPIRAVDVTDPVPLERGLDVVPQLTKQRANDIGSLYLLREPVAPVELRPRVVAFSDWSDQTKLAAALATLAATPGSALSDDPSAPDGGELWAGVVDAGEQVELDAPTTAVVTRTNAPALAYRLQAEQANGSVVLSAIEASPPALGEHVLTPRVAGRWDLGPVELLGVEVDGAVSPAGGAPDPVVPLSGTSIIRPLVADPAPALRPWGPLGDCFRYDDRNEDEVGLASSETVDHDGLIMRLEAADHRACRSAELVDPAPGTMYRLIQPVRAIEGAPPSVCLWLDGPQRCLELPAAGPSDDSGWQIIDATFTIPEGTSAARLYLYADRPQGEASRTVVDYRPARLSRWVAGEPLALSAPTVQPEVVELAAGRHPLGTPGQPPPAATAWSEVGDCDRRDERSFEELGLRALPIPGEPDAVRLTAGDHSACVHSELPTTTAGRTYTVTVPYHPVRGAVPRVCVFDTTERRCLPITGDVTSGNRLAAGTGWNTAHLNVGATGNPLALYVYSDGVPGSTVIDYRLPGLRALDAEVVTVLLGGDPPEEAAEVDASQGATVLEWAQLGDNRLRLRLQTDRPGAVIATSEAFDPGWRLGGLPSTASARHVRLDGYRNGWVIDAAGSYDLTISYAPDRTARWAQFTSLAALAMLTLRAALGPGLRSRGRRSLPPGRGRPHPPVRPAGAR
jgi:arabinofuranan 3-O-arabinosyltransferase